MLFRPLAALCLAASVTPASAFVSYIAQWIPVNYTDYGGWNVSTNVAQQEIVEAADWFAAQGPWCPYFSVASEIV